MRALAVCPLSVRQWRVHHCGLCSTEHADPQLGLLCSQALESPFEYFLSFSSYLSVCMQLPALHAIGLSACVVNVMSSASPLVSVDDKEV